MEPRDDAGQTAGSAHGGANGTGQPPAAQPGSGSVEADDIDTRIAKAKQEGFDTGFGKGKGRAEREAAQAIQAAAAAERARVLADLGIESDEALEAVKAERAGKAAGKLTPHEQELAKAKAEARKAADALRARDAVLAERDAKLATFAERYFVQYRRSLAASLGQKMGVHATAMADLGRYLDAQIMTEGDGDDAELVLKDGAFRFALAPDDDQDLAPLAAHIAKSCPHWIAPGTAARGSGVVPSRPTAKQNGQPEDPRTQFIRGIADDIAEQVRR